MRKHQYVDDISRAKQATIKHYAQQIVEVLMGKDESIFSRFMYRHVVDGLSAKCGVYQGSSTLDTTISSEDIDRSIHADEIKQLYADAYAMCYILDNIRRFVDNKTIEKITMHHHTASGVVDCVVTINKVIDSAGKVIKPRRAFIIQHSLFDDHSVSKTHAGLVDLVESPVFDGAIFVDTGVGVRQKHGLAHDNIVITTADSVVYALEELLAN